MKNIKLMKNIRNSIWIIAGFLMVSSCTENDHFISEPEPPKPEIPDEPASPSDPDDLTEIPDEARFRIALYDHHSFNGEKYPDNPAFSSPAPFDFIGFRMVLPGGFSPFGFQPYLCYDSIVWSSPDLPDTFKVFENSNNYTSLTSQWGSYFFKEGSYTVCLKGYRKGEIVHSDSLTFKLKDRDFLCFKWSECPIDPKPGVSQGIYCYLDGKFKYKITYPIEIDGCKVFNIYISNQGENKDEMECSVMKTMLEDFLESHLGKPVEYENADLKGMFMKLPDDDKFGKLYENKTTRAIIVNEQPDEDSYRRERFYIHVESK